ncbi:MAG: acyltransferase family protein [Bacilli bacterium]|nr:acyltransferase family protein [Bacilli bacterium]
MEDAVIENKEIPESKPKKRMPEQDIAKGFAILLVTMMHILVVEKMAFAIAGGLFGFIMSLFFFLSGYNYKPGRTYKENIIKRVKQVLIPFLIYMGIIVVAFTLYYTLSGQYTFAEAMQSYARSFLGIGFSNQIGLVAPSLDIYRSTMVCWFIIMLFMASLIFYAVVDIALKDAKRFISINAGLVVITMIFGFFNFSLPLYISDAPLIASIMLFGALFKKHDLFHLKSPWWTVINSVVAYGIYILMALNFKGAGYIMGGRLIRDYGAPEALITLLYSVIGTYAFLNFCKLIAKVKPLNFAFTWLGTNSVYILLLHQPVQLIVKEIMGYHPTASISTAEQTEWMSFAVWGITLAALIVYIILITFLKKKLKAKKA